MATPLTESLVQHNFAPLFRRVLAEDRVYLATHSLGRPLDRMAEDVAEALALWSKHLASTWDHWMEAREAYRAQIAALLHTRPGNILPTASAGAGLRIVLNALPSIGVLNPRVLTTTGEFHSSQVILEQYAAAGRVTLTRVQRSSSGAFTTEDILAAIGRGIDLLVISQVMYDSGQVIGRLDEMADACHQSGARLLVDTYHSAGALPVDLPGLSADFATGGCYKYLRGGNGAAFLYLSPEALASGLKPLDAGWFALRPDRAPQDFGPTALLPGSDSFLGDTPDVLPWFQSRSGLEFTLTVGVDRLRAWSLEQMRQLRGALEAEGVDQISGGDEQQGGFLTVRHARATEIAERLAEQRIVANARGEYLRMSPDCLTQQQELETAAKAVAAIIHGFDTA